jgi:hypothetical protein
MLTRSVRFVVAMAVVVALAAACSAKAGDKIGSCATLALSTSTTPECIDYSGITDADVASLRDSCEHGGDASFSTTACQLGDAVGGCSGPRSGGGTQIIWYLQSPTSNFQTQSDAVAQCQKDRGTFVTVDSAKDAGPG